MTIVPFALLTALLTHRHSNKPIRHEDRLIPMQHDLSLKVSSNLDRRHPRHDRGRDIVQQLNFSRFIRGLTQPMSVIRGDIDGTIEGPGPSRIRSVIVWVRDHDRNEAAFGFDLMGEAQSGLIYNVLYRVKQETHKFNGLCIKQSNQVPEDITILRLEQHSALTDAELGLCGNGPDT